MANIADSDNIHLLDAEEIVVIENGCRRNIKVVELIDFIKNQFDTNLNLIYNGVAKLDDTPLNKSGFWFVTEKGIFEHFGRIENTHDLAIISYDANGNYVLAPVIHSFDEFVIPHIIEVRNELETIIQNSLSTFNTNLTNFENDVEKRIDIIQNMVESDFKGIINPSITPPSGFEIGSYKPEISSEDNRAIDPNDWGTLYSNAGNLRAKKGYDTLFYFDGTTWQKAEVELPSNAAKKVFNPLDNEKASTMKATSERYEGFEDNLSFQSGLTNLSGNIVSNANYITTGKISANSGTVLLISDIVSTSEDYQLLLFKNSEIVYNYQCIGNSEVVIPPNVDSFSFTTPANSNAQAKIKFIGVIKKSLDTVFLQESILSKTWSDGNYSLSATPITANGVRKTNFLAINNDIQSLSFSNLNPNYQYTLLIFSDNKRISYKAITSGDVVYLKNSYIKKIALIVEGVENGNEIIKAFTESKRNTLLGAKEYFLEDFIQNGETDYTNSFNKAVAEVIKDGGGKIKLLDKVYNGTFQIPPIYDADWMTIEIEGSKTPTMFFGTVGSFSQTMRGTVIRNISDNIAQGVIDVLTTSQYGNFNAVQLCVRNATIITKDNPVRQGINAQFAYSLIVENCHISTGVYNPLSLEPIADTYGILTPNIDNAALTKLDNISVSGYRKGIRVNEHTSGNNIYIHGCWYGLDFITAGHSSHFGRLLIQRVRRPLLFSGRHRFAIENLCMETCVDVQTTPQTIWQKTDFELDDANNYGIGRLFFTVLEGNNGVAGANTRFRKIGGSNIDVKYINPNIPIVN